MIDNHESDCSTEIEFAKFSVLIPGSTPNLLIYRTVDLGRCVEVESAYNEG